MASKIVTGKPPFAPIGLDHLLLHVDGMDAALDFYTKVVGCAIKGRLPEYGMADLTGGVSLVDVASEEGAWAKTGAKGENVNHFAVRLGKTDDADVRAHLADHGIVIEEERPEGGDMSLYIRDPSGNYVELIFERG
jgi:glyoxylase I family protein